MPGLFGAAQSVVEGKESQRNKSNDEFDAFLRQSLPADKYADVSVPKLSAEQEGIVSQWMDRQQQEAGLYATTEGVEPTDERGKAFEYAQARKQAFDAAAAAGFKAPGKTTGRMGAITGGLMRGATFTLADEVVGLSEGIRALGDPNRTFGEGYEQGRSAVNALSAQQTRDYPVSSVVGEGLAVAPAYMAGGGFVSGGIKEGAKRAGLTSLLPQGASTGARLSRYGGRLAGLTAGGATAAGTHEAIFGEARKGEDASVGERARNFVDAAADPINAFALPALSVLTRGARGAITGGARVTPDSVSSRMAQDFSVPATQRPSNMAIQDVGQEVLEGQLQPGSIKSFRFIENMLRDSGFSGDRIASGFENIRNVLRSAQDTRLDLARLIEKEFATENPQVAQSIRSFLLKVGLDSPKGRATVLSATDALRKTQAQDLRETAQYELGTQPRMQAAEQAKTNMQGIGGLYEEALRQAPRDGDMSMLARQALEQAREAPAALGPRARAKGMSVDQYIDQNPLEALHWTQSLIRQSEDPFSKAIADNMADILDRSVPGYAGLRRQYGEQATLRDLVGRVEGGRLQGGFGDDLTRAANKELTADDIVSRYGSLTPEQRRAADLSIRDAFTDPLRQTKGTGVDEFGRDTAGARMTKLQQEGVIDVLDRMLGERGKALTQRVREFIDERQYAADIDPRTGSNTMNKANAQAEGANAFAGALGRSLAGAGGSVPQSLMADAALALTGNAPVITLARSGSIPNAFSRMLQPRQKSQVELADLLLRRAPSDGMRNAFSPTGGIKPINPLNDGRTMDDRMPLAQPGDPMRPASGRIPGGMPEGPSSPDELLYTADEIADVDYAYQRKMEAEAAEGAISRTRYNTANSPNAPDWNYPVPRRPQTFTDWVRSQGGINDEGGEISAAIGGSRGRPGVISNLKRGGQFSISGKSIQQIAEAAVEDGYIAKQGDGVGVSIPGPDEIVELLRKDMSGDHVLPIYNTRNLRDLYDWQAYEQWAEEAGVLTPYEVAAESRAAAKLRKKHGGLID
jgi:hypothetical protein